MYSIDLTDDLTNSRFRLSKLTKRKVKLEKFLRCNSFTLSHSVERMFKWMMNQMNLTLAFNSVYKCAYTLIQRILVKYQLYNII